MHIRDAKAVEIAQHLILIEAVYFVDDQGDRLLRFAQVFDDEIVAGRQPLPRIHQQHDKIGFFDGLQRLPDHHRVQPFFTAIDTTGIDNDEAALFIATFAVQTVAREAGKIGHERIPAIGQPVEQG